MRRATRVAAASLGIFAGIGGPELGMLGLAIVSAIAQDRENAEAA